MAAFSSSSLVRSLEERVQRDEGKRGIAALITPHQLYPAAMSLLQQRSIAILSGFPCLIDENPPTETDGILGTIAIAKALVGINKRVVIVTDECNELPFLAAAGQSGLKASQFRLESFPGRGTFNADDLNRLQSLSSTIDAVVAIERAGPSADGSCRTMRARDMTRLIAPLEVLITDPLVEEGFVSVGIGDGGNEVGMGKIYDTIISSKISNAETIANVVPTDHLLVASVSDWGGYALAASLAACALETDCITATPYSWLDDEDIPVFISSRRVFASRQEAISACMYSADDIIRICQASIDAGAKDGITGKQELSVDGMPLDVSIQVLQELVQIVLGSE